MLMFLSGTAGLYLPKLGGKIVEELSSLTQQQQQHRAYNDVLNEDKDAMYLVDLLVKLAGAVVLQQGSSAAAVLTLQNVGESLAKRLRRKVFSALMRERMGFFDDTARATMVSKTTTDIDLVRNVVSIELAQMLDRVFTILLSAALISTISLKLSMLTLFLAPLIAFSLGMFGERIIYPLENESRLRAIELTDAVDEAFCNIRAIKIFDMRDRILARFDVPLEKKFAADMRSAFGLTLFRGLIYLVAGVVLCAACWIGRLAILKGELDSSDLVAFLVYAVQIAVAFANSTRGFAIISTGMICAKSTFALLESRAIEEEEEGGEEGDGEIEEAQAKVKEKEEEERRRTKDLSGLPGALPAPRKGSLDISGEKDPLNGIEAGLGTPRRRRRASSLDKHFDFTTTNGSSSHASPSFQEVPVAMRGVIPNKIEFKSVCFTYPSRPSHAVLNKVNLVLRKGVSTALVGASGSGKSTVCSLLEKFYSPTAGDILVDDFVSLSALPTRAWRARISLVSQQPMLFTGTVRANIEMGRKRRGGALVGDAGEELSVERVAALANLRDVVESLPLGLDSDIGPRGAQMSGGQLARICLARALVRNPSVLILDEHTAQLDAKSERLVVEAMEAVMPERVCLVVAHRLSTARRCDQIAALMDGAVVETGSHDELIRAGGYYAGLWKAQQSTSSSVAASGQHHP